MKKLLVALVALSTVSAFAGNSMVRLDGCFDGQCDTLDFRMAGDDVEDSEGKLQNLALNYAMAFSGNWGAGIKFAQNTVTSDGDKSDPSYAFDGDAPNNRQTIGLSGYYNLDGAWDNSCFVALHYDMTTVQEGDTTDDSGWKETVITLEYGHRFMIGSVMGLGFNWSPSVTYSMAKATPDADGADDVNSTELQLNVANVAATF